MQNALERDVDNVHANLHVKYIKKESKTCDISNLSITLFNFSFYIQIFTLI